jgi:hypothetical protein
VVGLRFGTLARAAIRDTFVAPLFPVGEMIQRLALVGYLVAIVNFADASAASVKIKVIDEYNKGVASRVYYNDGTHRHSFFETSGSGEVPQAPTACGNIITLRARPIDSVAYFESSAQPCASNVVLRVFRRATSSGVAMALQLVPFTRPDGTAALLAIKVALVSTSQETDMGDGPLCELKLGVYVHLYAFRVQSDDWESLGQATTVLSTLATNAELPDSETVTLPVSCNRARNRIKILQQVAADRINRSLHKNAILLDRAIHALGLADGK